MERFLYIFLYVIVRGIELISGFCCLLVEILLLFSFSFVQNRSAIKGKSLTLISTQQCAVAFYTTDYSLLGSRLIKKAILMGPECNWLP